MFFLFASWVRISWETMKHLQVIRYTEHWANLCFRGRPLWAKYILWALKSLLCWSRTLKQTLLIQLVLDFTIPFSFLSLSFCVRVHSGEHEPPSCRGPRAPCTCPAAASRTSPGRVQEILGALHVLQSCCYCVGHKGHRGTREGTLFFFFNTFNTGGGGGGAGGSHEAQSP